MSFAIQIWPWKGQLGMYVFETGLKRLWNQTLRCCMIDTNYEFFKGTRKLSTQTCNSKKSCDCYSTCSLHATQTFARTIRITYNSKSVAIREASIEIFCGFLLYTLSWRHQRIANGFTLQFLIGVAEKMMADTWQDYYENILYCAKSG